MRKEFPVFFSILILSLLFLAADPMYGDGYNLIRDGIAAITGGDSQQGLSLFEKAAGSQDTEIAACGHFNYGTALAVAASKAEDPAQKRQILEKAVAALRRSYALLPSKDAQKNLYLVRRELMQLPPDEDKNQQNQKDSQKDQQNDRQDDQEQQQGQQGDQSSQNNDQNGENSQQNNQGTDEQNSGQQQQDAQNQQEPDGQSMGQQQAQTGEKDQDEAKPDEAQASKQGNEEQTEEEKELKQILDKEAREQAMRVLESAGGIQNVQKDW